MEPNSIPYSRGTCGLARSSIRTPPVRMTWSSVTSSIRISGGRTSASGSDLAKMLPRKRHSTQVEDPKGIVPHLDLAGTTKAPEVSRYLKMRHEFRSEESLSLSGFDRSLVSWPEVQSVHS